MFLDYVISIERLTSSNIDLEVEEAFEVQISVSALRRRIKFKSLRLVIIHVYNVRTQFIESSGLRSIIMQLTARFLDLLNVLWRNLEETEKWLSPNSHGVNENCPTYPCEFVQRRHRHVLTVANGWKVINDFVNEYQNLLEECLLEVKQFHNSSANYLNTPVLEHCLAILK